MMNLGHARSRVAEVLYRATATIERQDASGAWFIYRSGVPCSIRAQRGQPVAAQPDDETTGQRLMTWRMRCDVGTGVAIGDRVTADTEDYGLITIVIGAVSSGSLTVSETSFGTREEWASEGDPFTFIRFNQDTETEERFGPYFARKLTSDTRNAIVGAGSIGTPVTVWLRLDASANVEIGDIVPELAGGEVTEVHEAIDGAIEIAVRTDAGAAESVG